MSFTSPTVKPWQVTLVLTLVSAWYLCATLPYLGDFPILDWGEMGIVAPAHKLSTDGVYGNDLFAGYHRSEQRNYEYMPAYPLLVALSFELFEPGVWQARLVSVACGWLTLILTFVLGQQLYGRAVGLVAAILLVTLRVGLVPNTTGIALVDFARVIRYDILVPVFVLAACCTFIWAQRESQSDKPRRVLSSAAFVGAGVLAGLATLAHVYGGFALAVMLAVLVWQSRGRIVRSPAPYLIACGWILALLPWIVYVSRDFQAYLGQMSRHQGRFDLFDLDFYWQNLYREPWRYAAWSGGSLQSAFLSPRVGFWLVLVGIPASSLLLWRRANRAGALLSDRFLLLALPVLELCLALLIVLKRYRYTSLVIPFIALQLALVGVVLQRWANRRNTNLLRFAGPAIVLLAIVESGVGVVRHHAEARQATPYLALGETIARNVPVGSRLLISQPYWLVLKLFGHEDLRSVNLLFSFPRTLTMEQIMERLDAEFVVIESYFLEADPVDPRSGAGNLSTRPVFEALGAYLLERCPEGTTTRQTPDYGTIETYDCRSAAGRPESSRGEVLIDAPSFREADLPVSGGRN